MKTTVATLLIFLLIFQTLSSISPPDAILKKIEFIEKEVEQIRGLKFEEKPKIIIITREDAKLLFSPPRPTKEMKLWEIIYKVTFILPPEASLFKEEKEDTANWIAATVGDKIYIIRENFLESGDVALRATAHELTHILQRDLNATYSGRTLDETLAIRALVEGDADLVADMFCKKNGIKIVKITNISRKYTYWSLNVFPYVFGDRFVRFLYEKGGWKLVNQAYKNPPTSTKVVMFPELYLKGWKPENVTVNEKGILEDTLGAYYVFLISWEIYDWGTAMEIARGWAGDRIVLTRNNKVIWKIKFENKELASLFEKALKSLAQGQKIAKYKIERMNSTVEMVAQFKPPSS
ncbi:hypothetical protein A3L04_01905 [Thermococcus chitonophagus]|uniref:DUF4157 domain-containing protein n=1 Tax=Thermococcus chitonophagus TaxID=54262 RepID=A0A160VQM5_9EURY|nr:hypothetical protein [Thermococcus chitonophagus]ASJ15914.1 hypothetical protein A3L04_01905 [Thermococcus chitonophagus]CUX77157.1 hypothetical protein CHITON_0378 [Thermococcus chitonophagus]